MRNAIDLEPGGCVVGDPGLAAPSGVLGEHLVVEEGMLRGSHLGIEELLGGIIVHDNLVGVGGVDGQVGGTGLGGAALAGNIGQGEVDREAEILNIVNQVGVVLDEFLGIVPESDGGSIVNAKCDGCVGSAVSESSECG